MGKIHKSPPDQSFPRIDPDRLDPFSNANSNSHAAFTLGYCTELDRARDPEPLVVAISLEL